MFTIEHATQSFCKVSSSCCCLKKILNTRSKETEKKESSPYYSLKQVIEKQPASVAENSERHLQFAAHGVLLIVVCKPKKQKQKKTTCFNSINFTFCVISMRIVTQLQSSTRNLLRNISPLGRST